MFGLHRFEFWRHLNWGSSEKTLWPKPLVAIVPESAVTTVAILVAPPLADVMRLRGLAKTIHQKR